MTKTILPVSMALIFSLLAGAAHARPALKDVTEVREGIIAVGMAYEISQKCDSLSARIFRGYSYLNSLKDIARLQGYTDQEIDAYVDDAAEKRRLESIARSRLAERGAVAGQGESYCAIGRAEMARNSAIGRLLR